MLWVGPSLGAPPILSQAWERVHGKKRAIPRKSLRGFPTGADGSDPHSTPLPHPAPSVQNTHVPVPLIHSFPWAARAAVGRALEEPTSRQRSQKPPWGALSVPQAQMSAEVRASRGLGSGTGRWAGLDRNGTRVTSMGQHPSTS